MLRFAVSVRLGGAAELRGAVEVAVAARAPPARGALEANAGSTPSSSCSRNAAGAAPGVVSERGGQPRSAAYEHPQVRSSGSQVSVKGRDLDGHGAREGCSASADPRGSPG